MPPNYFIVLLWFPQRLAAGLFVDILDFYPFDTSVAHGDHLELRVNGVKCDFTHPVKEGDQIQIEWVG